MDNSDKKKELRKDVKHYGALEVFAESPAGQIFLKGLRLDIINAIDELTGNFKTAQLSQLVALIAIVKERMDFIRLFENSKVNAHDAEKELKEILQAEKLDPELD